MLFVCTGNVCRSPFAEILTRHVLIGRLGGRGAAAFGIASAGVRAVVGAPMHPQSRAELAPWGLDVSVAGRFVARQLEPGHVAESDLILGATRRHRTAVIQQNPVALQRVFSIREFARLTAHVDPTALSGSPVERARMLVGLARAQRGLVPPDNPEDDDVADPMGRSAEAHHEAAQAIRAAVHSIIDAIAPRRARW